MFQPIRRRLLLSYLLALSAVLVGFAIAVRVVFAHSLTQQLHEKLVTLGQGAANDLELENDHVTLKSDFPLQALHAQAQALEWFDRHGKSIGHRGQYYLTLPFVGQDVIQIQLGNPRIQAVTLPVISSDSGQLLGYVRASQSLKELDEALQYLDWGMAGGIGIALMLSSGGGFLLTQQAMKPIERSFAQLQQFTADASHELRSPLMAIQANAQVALKYAEGIRLGDREKFEAIVSAVQQLTHLTEDLLFLTRADILPQASFTRVNLTELLTHLIQLYQPQAISQSIELKLSIIGTQYTLGDSAQLQRLFTNLLDNALRYTPPGGHISVHSQLAESQLWVTVQDTGIGIAPDQIARVFDRFWQADPSRSSRSGSCGLGLAIAQTIAQQHGGIITAFSQPGSGSCFTTKLSAVLTGVKVAKLSPAATRRLK